MTIISIPFVAVLRPSLPVKPLTLKPSSAFIRDAKPLQQVPEISAETTIYDISLIFQLREMLAKTGTRLTVNDLLVIKLSSEHPARMPLYAASATLGSVLGCILIFLLARKGEEALFQRKAGRHAAAIRHWIERNRCCPCEGDKWNVEHTTTNATVPHRYSLLWN